MQRMNYSYLSFMVINLSEKHSLVSNWVSELRAINIQTDRMRFRKNLERIAEVMAYEISKMLSFAEEEIETPLGLHTSKVLKEQPVIATILRAGLAMHQGLLNYFDHADNAFISAYRKHHKDGSFEIELQYFTSPNLTDKVLIVSDPMLATGASLVKTLEALNEMGKPKEIHIVCAIAATEGIEHLQKIFDDRLHIWCGDIDEELTAKGYIVPGLGDAGDLAYGEKAQF